jgi:hypothetical protein
MIGVDMDEVRHWARRYYAAGYNPLPSRGDAKRPALKAFKRYLYRDRIPEAWLKRWWSSNIQIPLGVRWGVCVVDIDGNAGSDEWLWRIVSRSWKWKTWVSGAPVSRSSRHIWFRIPESIESFPTTVLWKGKNSHEEIKVLGDGALAIVPPSIHPDRGTRYEWLVGPDELWSPALLPDWLLRRITEARQKPPSPPPVRPVPSGLHLPSRSGRHYQRDEVLYALGDRKHEIAAAYGLEVHRHPASSGFHACRSISREDSNWSCTIDPRTGVYKDWATGEVLPFYTVLMRLDPGTFPDFPTTVDLLGSYVFGGQPCPESVKSKSKLKT